MNWLCELSLQVVKLRCLHIQRHVFALQINRWVDFTQISRYYLSSGHLHIALTITCVCKSLFLWKGTFGVWDRSGKCLSPVYKVDEALTLSAQQWVSEAAPDREVHGCLNCTPAWSYVTHPYISRLALKTASRHTVFVKWLTVQHSHLERHFTSTFTSSFGDKYTISIGLWKTKIDSAISLTVFLGLLSSGNFRLGTTGGRFPKWCFKEWCTWLNASMSVEQHVHTSCSLPNLCTCICCLS